MAGARGTCGIPDTLTSSKHETSPQGRGAESYAIIHIKEINQSSEGFRCTQVTSVPSNPKYSRIPPTCLDLWTASVQVD